MPKYKNLLEPLAQELYNTIKQSGMPTWKYPAWQSILEIMSFYHQLFDIAESRGHKHVLDFGCGFGMSQRVYDLSKWSFKLTLGDTDNSWFNNEKNYFDYVLEKHNISILRFGNILSEEFKFLSNIIDKFDCVLTVRFPPVSRMQIPPSKFKEKLAPYCVDNFEYFYLHKSEKALTELNLPNEALRLMRTSSHKQDFSTDNVLIRMY